MPKKRCHALVGPWPPNLSGTGFSPLPNFFCLPLNRVTHAVWSCRDLKVCTWSKKTGDNFIRLLCMFHRKRAGVQKDCSYFCQVLLANPKVQFNQKQYNSIQFKRIPFVVQCVSGVYFLLAGPPKHTDVWLISNSDY